MDVSQLSMMLINHALTPCWLGNVYSVCVKESFEKFQTNSNTASARKSLESTILNGNKDHRFIIYAKTKHNVAMQHNYCKNVSS